MYSDQELQLSLFPGTVEALRLEWITAHTVDGRLIPVQSLASLTSDLSYIPPASGTIAENEDPFK